MTPNAVGPEFLNEIASIFSNLPIALYALGFHVQDGLVSAICNKAAAPVPFIGAVADLKTIWNIKQSDLFGVLGHGTKLQVASLRHGNTFPLVNKAILTAAGCIEQSPAVHSDLTMPRAVNANTTFLLPKEATEGATVSAKLVGGLVGCFEISAFVCSGVWQGLRGMYFGAALTGCLAFSTTCYLVLQQLAAPIYASQSAIQNDKTRTVKNGAATDVHVVVPDWNSDEMYVLVGYSSQLHSLTNVPVRVNKPLLLLWTCRVLGVVLCAQAALLAKIIQTPPPAVFGSPIWLISILVAYAVRVGLSKIVSKVDLGTEPIEVVRAPQIVFPARRTALAFIASLPMTPSKADKWDWVDGFLPNNERRQSWQQEMDMADLVSADEAEVNLSDDGRRIVTQVRNVRFTKKLLESIDRYEAKVGLDQKNNFGGRKYG